MESGYAWLVMMFLWLLIGVASFTQTQQMNEEMQQLAEDYETCLNSLERTSPCILEYDGDGSSYKPSDYHWYAQSEQ